MTKQRKSSEVCDIKNDISASISTRLQYKHKLWRTKANSKQNSFCFVFVNPEEKLSFAMLLMSLVRNRLSGKTNRTLVLGFINEAPLKRCQLRNLNKLTVGMVEKTERGARSAEYGVRSRSIKCYCRLGDDF